MFARSEDTFSLPSSECSLAVQTLKSLEAAGAAQDPWFIHQPPQDVHLLLSVLKCCRILARYPLLARSVTAPGQFGISRAWYRAPAREESRDWLCNGAKNPKSLTINPLCVQKKTGQTHINQFKNDLKKLTELHTKEKKVLVRTRNTHF